MTGGISAFEVREKLGSSFSEYEATLNDFSQRFLITIWEEADNLVFSPFGLHSVLAMLTSGASDDSKTQRELLQAFGRHGNIQNIESSYGDIVEQYKILSKNIFSFGNRFYTTEKHYQLIEYDYLVKITQSYDADIKFFAPSNPEKAINEWVKEKTNGKIDKIIGMQLLL